MSNKPKVLVQSSISFWKEKNTNLGAADPSNIDKLEYKVLLRANIGH